MKTIKIVALGIISLSIGVMVIDAFYPIWKDLSLVVATASYVVLFSGWVLITVCIAGILGLFESKAEENRK